MFGVPSFIEEWSHQPELRKWLATRSGVLFGGGTLDKESGDSMISEGIQLFTGYGLTEAGVVNPLLPKQSLGYDWDHFTFAKNVKPELIPQGDGTFELVLLATPFNNPSVINTKIRGEDAYATSDLIVPHPTKEGLWKVYGRCDDQIMHSSGEKTNPGPLESILNQDPLVQSSVIFGRGQFQAGALIQPAKEWQFDPEMDQDRVGEFRNKIWPTVERMNEFAPQHTRLFHEVHILYSSLDLLTITFPIHIIANLKAIS
ncbi:hypothetical protein MPER_01965 [Moniliophthora perniciosa FA553]|nr:hypothetical protein MPER_01965 [Moniliophthora perniciosa FA553]